LFEISLDVRRKGIVKSEVKNKRERNGKRNKQVGLRNRNAKSNKTG